MAHFVPSHFPFCYFIFISLSRFSNSPPYVEWLYACFQPLQAGLLDRKKRLMYFFVCLLARQAEEKGRTKNMAWSHHRAGLTRKPLDLKQQKCGLVWRRQAHMLHDCTGRNFESIYLCEILVDYTCQCNKCHLACIYSVDVGNYTIVRVIVSHLMIFIYMYKTISCVVQEWCAPKTLDLHLKWKA